MNTLTQKELKEKKQKEARNDRNIKYRRKRNLIKKAHQLS